MDMAVIKEIEALRKMTVGGLRQSYDEVFGEESRSNGAPTPADSSWLSHGKIPLARPAIRRRAVAHAPGDQQRGEPSRLPPGHSGTTLGSGAPERLPTSAPFRDAPPTPLPRRKAGWPA